MTPTLSVDPRVYGYEGEKAIITLTWDKPVDLDLSYYDNKSQKWLYPPVDSTSFGPEEIVIESLNADYYFPEITSYSDFPTVATLTIQIGGKSYTRTKFFQYKYDFWEDVILQISPWELMIKNVLVDGNLVSDNTTLNFTTESEISVETESREFFDNSRIKYQLVQVNYSRAERMILEAGGYNAKILLQNYTFNNLPLFDKKLAWNRTSEPLYYELNACLDDCTSGVQSSKFIFKQNPVGQLRQEYIDKKQLFSNFVIEAPPENSILNPILFDTKFQSSGVSFREINIAHDYKDINYLCAETSPLMVADFKKMFILDSGGTSVIPYINSTWRNPRRNDRIGGAINSDHQKGNAVDFGVRYENDLSRRPAESYNSLVSQLYEKACLVFSYTETSVTGRGPKCFLKSNPSSFLINEGNHVHASN
jgi:hypothetical protein